ncbi:hypothetical protein [Kordia periserrulae]|nr:hypothetical protein [Kordia periserrulae]
MTKTKSNTLTTGDKFLIILISIGAVIGFTAPFIHIFLDKDSEIEVFGYYNARMFFYAVGIPITLFVGSVCTYFSSMFIHISLIKKIMTFISFMLMAISIYYITWSIWAKKDFNDYLYYSSIIILSLLVSYLFSILIKRTTKNAVRLSNIGRNVKVLQDDSKTINDIASIMPSKEETITYKAMIDVTGDSIDSSIQKIENEINKD